MKTSRARSNSSASPARRSARRCASSRKAASSKRGATTTAAIVRFREDPGKVDLTQTTRFAEGEAEREAFSRFCSLALDASAELLEQIVNRPIYPDDVPLLK